MSKAEPVLRFTLDLCWRGGGQFTEFLMETICLHWEQFNGLLSAEFLKIGKKNTKVLPFHGFSIKIRFAHQLKLLNEFIHCIEIVQPTV